MPAASKLGALRDALLEAGATPEEAGKAAEEIAMYERDVADMKADLRMLKWAHAATCAAVMAVFVRIFLHWQ